MNILWLTNVILPEASEMMNEPPSPFGGWLVSSSKHLSEQDNIQLSIAFPKKGELVGEIKGEKIKYYPFSPISKKNITLKCCIGQLNYILDLLKPDLVHIYGTEFVHSKVMLDLCKTKKIKTVISIQGLVSICEKHYMAYLPIKIQKRYTIRDFIKQDNLIKQQQRFLHRGKLEIDTIKNADNVIGRTTWDNACVTQINPGVNYHFCNETLRNEFYKHSWSIDECEKNAIFISQARYPIKGFHILLEAMPTIIRMFPDTKIYVAGHKPYNTKSFISRLKMTSYSKYINDLISALNLKNRIEYVGLLGEKDMCDMYLKSHVFVCPSSIENSPNSLCEAMILGLPCVASYAGGIPDLLKHGEEGFLYQPDAPYMLAYYICEIFKNDLLANKFSMNARNRALTTHDCEVNTKQLLDIYKSILNIGGEENVSSSNCFCI